MGATHEDRKSFWALFLGPGIWALHFLLSYVSAAVWCAKLPDADFDLLRLTVGIYTLVALALIALSAHRYGESAGSPHDRDTDDDRHRFLGFTSLLLCSLAAIATLYSAMAVVFIRSCA